MVTKELRLAASALTVITLSLVAGCAATSVTSQGAEVELVDTKPVGCKLLGDAVGKQGNVFSGDFTTNENLMVGARNDLKNQAAAMNGNVVWVQNTLNATHPYSTGAVSTTMVGSVYACPKGQ
jgi:hypothetical protein